jgi:hypothetical protein
VANYSSWTPWTATSTGGQWRLLSGPKCVYVYTISIQWEGRVEGGQPRRTHIGTAAAPSCRCCCSWSPWRVVRHSGWPPWSRARSPACCCRIPSPLTCPRSLLQHQEQTHHRKTQIGIEEGTKRQRDFNNHLSWWWIWARATTTAPPQPTLHWRRTRSPPLWWQRNETPVKSNARNHPAETRGPSFGRRACGRPNLGGTWWRTPGARPCASGTPAPWRARGRGGSESPTAGMAVTRRGRKRRCLQRRRWAWRRPGGPRGAAWSPPRNGSCHRRSLAGPCGRTPPRPGSRPWGGRRGRTRTCRARSHRRDRTRSPAASAARSAWRCRCSPPSAWARAPGGPSLTPTRRSPRGPSSPRLGRGRRCSGIAAARSPGRRACGRPNLGGTWRWRGRTFLGAAAQGWREGKAAARGWRWRGRTFLPWSSRVGMARESGPSMMAAERGERGRG